MPGPVSKKDMKNAPTHAGFGKVLLIEDETAIRQMMMSAIETIGEFRVIGECSTAAEGLRLAETLQPDVVVLDWVLENGTGKEFLRAIQNWKKRPAVLIFSGQTSALAVRDAFSCGASGFIEKNCRLTDFIDALRDLVEGRVHLGTDVARLMKGMVLTNETEKIGAALSEREIDVLRLVAEGCSSKEIGDRLGISVRTVDSHRAALIKKTGMHSVAELTRHAFGIGIVSAPRAARG
jgi:DNA-binding NarL/FixJ family response regulator